MEMKVWFWAAALALGLIGTGARADDALPLPKYDVDGACHRYHFTKAQVEACGMKELNAF
jgi:hypothetical protein